MKGRLGVEDLNLHLEATGMCSPIAACLVLESLLESSQPVSQKIIVLSQKQTQFSMREVSGEVFQILLVDWDTESDNILLEHTGTSLVVVLWSQSLPGHRHLEKMLVSFRFHFT